MRLVSSRHPFSSSRYSTSLNALEKRMDSIIVCEKRKTYTRKKPDRPSVLPGCLKEVIRDSDEQDDESRYEYRGALPAVHGGPYQNVDGI